MTPTCGECRWLEETRDFKAGKFGECRVPLPYWARYIRPEVAAHYARECPTFSERGKE